MQNTNSKQDNQEENKPKIPNEVTLNALKAECDPKRFKSVEELFLELDKES
jgi:hypothetical protein